MLKIRIDRVKSSNFILFIFLYLLIFISLVFVVRYEYAFVKANLIYIISYSNSAIAFVCVLISALILTFIKIKDFLYSVSSLILIFFVLPSAALFSIIEEIDSRILISHVLLLICVILIGQIKIKLKTKKLEVSQSIFILKIILIAGMVPFVVLYTPYINLRNLLLIDVYETRALIESTITNVYTSYTYSWFNKFIIPCLLVFGIYYRNRITIIICIVSLIFLFLCGAHKAVFFGLIFMFLLYKYDYLFKINYLLKILIGISLLALSMSLAFKSDFLMTLSIRRALLLPGLIDVIYFDFFNGNFLYWSESLNGLFMDYPFKMSHSYVIGEKYFNDPSWGANNGIISDGFMNFGMTGVIINIVIISFYFSLLNQLNISPKFFGLFFLFVILILSSSLTTVLLTHGGMVLVLLSFFFMKNTNEQMTH